METEPNRKACLEYHRSYKEKKGSFSVNFLIINYKSTTLNFSKEQSKRSQSQSPDEEVFISKYVNQWKEILRKWCGHIRKLRKNG